jgi:hypothetical protein
VNHRENLHLLREQRIQLGQIEQAFVAGDGKIRNFRAGFLREQLPRHEVAVMLHFREQNHVAGLEIFCSPRTRDEIDAFGRAAHEDDFVGAFGVDEFRGARARGFKGVRGAIAQLVDAAMDIGVVVFVIMHERVNHRARFLRRGGVVEINQRLAVDFLIENRKIFSQRRPVNCFAYSSPRKVTASHR